MSNLVKSTNFGGIYARSLHAENYATSETNRFRKYQKFAGQLEKYQKILQKSWRKTRNALLSIKNNLQSHLSEKQELYWPILIAITLLLVVFASRVAFAETGGAPNSLPISDNSKLNLIGFKKTPDPVKMSPAIAQTAPQDESNSEIESLKNDVAGIVKNTPMAAMIDPISEKDRIVAAFIVGIAMKESKFGAYAPHIGGRDCYNYWGLKAGGKTTAGGYSCFSSPEEAVSVVGKTVEKMIAKGVHTPAQAISWKCGASCAGQGAEDVRKWVADVAVNFNKINS
ncbi:MAG: hypothetical protein NT170_00020 [Candidatus Moranbacteria bacterium]|nr:hypothetical protein [Candidatus Moranbacteria bacterium]